MNEKLTMGRRHFMLGAASVAGLALAGCTSTSRMPEEPRFSEYYQRMYGAMPYERFPIPAVNLRQLDPNFFRTEVDDPTGERPGTLVVDTNARYLYLVLENRRAIRYGVGIGREGFAWSGRGKIGRKAEWPRWTPPSSMIARQPELEPYRNGMEPGLQNPLGARALYIYRDGVDTLYRLHGTPEYWTIGQAVSSGCVRLVNQDVIDLYGRVPVGTDVVVL